MNPMNTPKTLLETLVAMRELLTPPERWTKVVYACDATGGSVHPFNEAAVAFTLQAACLVQHHRNFNQVQEFLLNRTGVDAYLFNQAETTTHADILAKLDEAIAIAREEGL